MRQSLRNKRANIDAIATKREKKSSRGEQGSLCKKVRNGPSVDHKKVKMLSTEK